MRQIFRWDGRYFGFLTPDGFLLDAGGRYHGWVDPTGRAWAADGAFLGELLGGSYLGVYIHRTLPFCRMPRARPDPGRGVR